MIYFPILRTKRLTVQLRELTIGESCDLAGMPTTMHEATRAAFLRHVVKDATGVTDPGQWTIQEQMVVTCHYQAAVADDGPDFAIGGGRYTDYLDTEANEFPDDMVRIGEVGGDEWHIRHLTGAMAQSIERISGEIAGTGYRHWLIGAMAAQLARVDDEPDPAAEGAYDDRLVSRMKIFNAFPESDFTALLSLYLSSRTRLHHLIATDFAQDGGIVSLPHGRAESDLPSARFPARSCLSGIALSLV